MALWLVADWHLGTDEFDIRQRPFTSPQEHVEFLTTKHNSVVSPDDEVLVVGDVVDNKAHKTYLNCVSEFNGRKRLIRGNHDRRFSDSELSQYFYRVEEEGDGLEVDCWGMRCWATHYPSRGRADMFNLVGHIHSAWKYQLNMFNVGVDVNHFYPVAAEKIPWHFGAVCHNFDNDTWIAYNELNVQYRKLRGRNTYYFEENKTSPAVAK
jgi:calcineurin-like phosphoesterase family protein